MCGKDQVDSRGCSWMKTRGFLTRVSESLDRFWKIRFLAPNEGNTPRKPFGFGSDMLEVHRGKSGGSKGDIPRGDLRTRPPLTEVSRALRARNAEKISKMSPGLQPRDPEKSPKSLGDSPKSLRRVSKESFSETFLGLFGVPGPEAPGDIFETFSAFRARRARETSVRGGRVRKGGHPKWDFAGNFHTKSPSSCALSKAIPHWKCLPDRKGCSQSFGGPHFAPR